MKTTDEDLLDAVSAFHDVLLNSKVDHDWKFVFNIILAMLKKEPIKM